MGVVENLVHVQILLLARCIKDLGLPRLWVIALDLHQVPGAVIRPEELSHPASELRSEVSFSNGDSSRGLRFVGSPCLVELDPFGSRGSCALLLPHDLKQGLLMVNKLEESQSARM